jgi:hypothetical protein
MGPKRNQRAREKWLFPCVFRTVDSSVTERVFGGALLLTLFAPWIGAEDRPDFKRPDRKAERRLLGSSPADWERDSGGWPF